MDSNQALFLRTSKTAWFLEVSEAQILVAFCLATRHLERDIIMKWDWLQNPGRFGVKFEAVCQQNSRFNVVSIGRFYIIWFQHVSFTRAADWITRYSFLLRFAELVLWSRSDAKPSRFAGLRSRCYGCKTPQKNYLFPTKESLKHHKIQVLVQLCCIGKSPSLTCFWTWHVKTFWLRKKGTFLRKDQLS